MSEEKKQMNVDAVIDSMKQKGERVSVKDVNDMLVDVEFTADQLEKIYETLENMGVDVVGEMSDPTDQEVQAEVESGADLEATDFHRRPGAHVFKRDRQGSPFDGG